MTFRITIRAPRTTAATRFVYARGRLIEARLRGLPGVTAVGGQHRAAARGRGPMLGFAVDGAPPPPPNVNPEIAVASVSPTTSRRLAPPLKRGRAFTDAR